MELHYFHAMNPRKACAVAKLLKLPMTYRLVDVAGGGLRTAEFLALNPNAKAPVLVDGDLKLSEAAAILVYLVNQAGSDLWPGTADQQVEVLRWISWDAWEWAPAIGTFYFEHGIKPVFGLGAPDQALLASKAPRVAKLAAILDAHVASTDYLANGRLSVADFHVAAMLPDWQAHHMPLGDYRHLLAWHERLMAIPEWRDPWPA
ncbi:glutathione S-transferase family protein [Panacagrimonas sp.]|uniref:glutathione S-transferase family protein n=1 Tax=Panacagrimonas sp. TaxID=2480088 RepID=UPI003B525C53